MQEEEVIRIRIKIVLGGQTAVGKTSFITRVIENTFSEIPRFNTIGEDFKSKDYRIGNIVATAQLWDICGGQRRMRYRAPFFRNSHAVFLCFNVNDVYSFEALQEWIIGVQQFGLGCPVYLVGCQCDREHHVLHEDILKLVEKHHLTYFECSAKDNIGIADNVKDIVQGIVNQLRKNSEQMDKAKIKPKQTQSNSICAV